MDRDVNVGDVDLPASLNEIANQMKDLNMAIDSKKRQSIFHYTLMGRIMEAVQKRKGKNFIQYCHQYLPEESYSRSQIYFLIKLHKVALTYCKLIRVSVPIGVLKSKFKLVEQLCQEEKDYWMDPL